MSRARWGWTFLALAACGSSYSSAGTGSVDAGPDAAPSVVTGLVSSPGKVACGTQACDLTTEQCYFSGSSDFSCQARTSECPSSVARCDEAADCSDGKVCCGAVGLGTSTTDCETTCSAINEAQACRTDAECGTQGCIEQSCVGFTTWLCGLNPFCQKL